MTAIYHPDIQQGTPAWDAIRAGKWTASNGAKIMGALTTQGLKDLIKDMAWGRAFGKTDRGYMGESMKRGLAVEPEARDAYAFQFDTQVEQVGFVEHGRIANFGWSPDGLVDGRRKGLEIKSLENKARTDVFNARQIPRDYRRQARIACMVGQLEELDFWVYHPLAGGILLHASITPGEQDQIEARLALLEPQVVDLTNRLLERKAAA